MQLPRNILIGKDVLNRVINLCKGLGFENSVFLITDPTIYDLTAHDVMMKFKKADYQVDYSIVTKSNIDTVNEVMTNINDFKPEVILGVGGGTVIDVAKLSSTYSNLPFISIPTAASHDGISSSRASIKGMNKPTSIQAQAPLAILADTSVISSAPYKLTASGCGDIISKYTSVKDWELAHKVSNEYYGEYAANLAMMSAKLVMRNAKLISKNDERGLRIVLEALISCGVAMSIAGSSRPCSGSEHLFSHALDLIAEKPALHGEQCGVGAIMMAYLQKRNWKKVQKKLKILHCPTSANELEIDPHDIIEALTIAHTIRPERHTILGVDGLTAIDAKNIASVTQVID
jgi:glycerol-1-phosphate dehydrogenase [NAD(P)+]